MHWKNYSSINIYRHSRATGKTSFPPASASMEQTLFRFGVLTIVCLEKILRCRYRHLATSPGFDPTVNRHYARGRFRTSTGCSANLLFFGFFNTSPRCVLSPVSTRCLTWGSLSTAYPFSVSGATSVNYIKCAFTTAGHLFSKILSLLFRLKYQRISYCRAFSARGCFILLVIFEDHSTRHVMVDLA